MYRLEEDPPANVFCENCGEWVEPIGIDFGIGPYEYWGAKGIHKDIRPCCPLCEGELKGGNS